MGNTIPGGLRPLEARAPFSFEIIGARAGIGSDCGAPMAGYADLVAGEIYFRVFVDASGAVVVPPVLTFDPVRRARLVELVRRAVLGERVSR